MPGAEVQSTQRKRQDTAYPEAKSPEIPLLENGDHLTREEFERFEQCVEFVRCVRR